MSVLIEPWRMSILSSVEYIRFHRVEGIVIKMARPTSWYVLILRYKEHPANVRYSVRTVCIDP